VAAAAVRLLLDLVRLALTLALFVVVLVAVLSAVPVALAFLASALALASCTVARHVVTALAVARLAVALCTGIGGVNILQAEIVLLGVAAAAALVRGLVGSGHGGSLSI